MYSDILYFCVLPHRNKQNQNKLTYESHYKDIFIKGEMNHIVCIFDLT